MFAALFPLISRTQLSRMGEVFDCNEGRLRAQNGGYPVIQNCQGRLSRIFFVEGGVRKSSFRCDATGAGQKTDRLWTVPGHKILTVKPQPKSNSVLLQRIRGIFVGVSGVAVCTLNKCEVHEAEKSGKMAISLANYRQEPECRSRGRRRRSNQMASLALSLPAEAQLDPLLLPPPCSYCTKSSPLLLLAPSFV